MRRAVLAAVMLMGTCAGGWAQASALPSAQSDAPGTVNTAKRGRALMDSMVTALGGEAWLGRKDWKIEGRFATFYKGLPHDEVPQFVEYYRAQPFGERIIMISHFGVFIATNHADVAEVWTGDTGYEVTYKGSKVLPAKDVDEYMRRRRYSLDAVVGWLKDVNVQAIYEGPATESRHLAEKVSVLTPKNDVVTLMLDASTHLPLSLTYQWRDPLYQDLNTDVVQFDDYHVIQGIQTPFSITHLHNGDMVSQRFVTKVAYNLSLPDDLFDPARPLSKGTSK